MSFGIRAHDLLPFETADELGKIANQYGLKHVQLSLPKCFPNQIHAEQMPTIGLARTIKNQLKTHNIDVSVLSCYINMSAKNPEIRKQEVAKFSHYLQVAHAIEAGVVGTETGSLAEGFTEENFTEQAFSHLLGELATMCETAASLGVLIGIEPGINHPLHTNEKVKRMLDILDSPNVKIIYDVGNLLTLDNYQQQQALMTESFALFGQAIQTVHLKDIRFENGEKKNVPVGTGIVDFPHLLSLVHTWLPGVDLIFDEVEDLAAYPRAKAYIDACIK